MITKIFNQVFYTNIKNLLILYLKRASASTVNELILDLRGENDIEDIENTDSIFEDEPDEVPIARASLDNFGREDWLHQKDI